MQIKEYLNLVCEQIKYKPAREDISNEIKNHIEEIKEDFIANGESEEKAEEKAIEQMGDGSKIGQELNKIHKPKFDWKLAIIFLVLIGFGFAIAFLKTKSSENVNYIIKNIFYMGIGLALGSLIYFFDFKKIQNHSMLLYVVASVLVIITKRFGVSVNGLKYYFIAGTSIRTIAFVVPLYIISFIGFLERKYSENDAYIGSCFLAFLSLILICLIATIPTVMVLGLVYMIVLTVKFIQSKESKWKIGIVWILPIIFGLLFLAYGYNLDIGYYRWSRIMISLNPELDPQGGGWVILKRKEVIDSAKLFGATSNFAYIQNLIDEGTDFAFLTILSHFGWVLSFALVVTIIGFNLRIIYDSKQIKDSYGKLLMIGISVLFILQSIFNILVNLNLFIESGYSLPFVSYGGSNLIANIMCLALILSVYRKKDLIINVKEIETDEIAGKKYNKISKIINLIFESEE